MSYRNQKKITSLGNIIFRTYKALEERTVIIIYTKDRQSRRVKALKNRSKERHYI